MLNSKIVKILVFSLLLSGCTTTQRPHQNQVPPVGYYNGYHRPAPHAQSQQPPYAPPYQSVPPRTQPQPPQYQPNPNAPRPGGAGSNTPSKSEIFFRTFCAQHSVPYKSDECRKVFLKEWAQESVRAGSDLTKEGFSQIDQFMRAGSRKLGEKWGEYAREFRRGARKGGSK